MLILTTFYARKTCCRLGGININVTADCTHSCSAQAVAVATGAARNATTTAVTAVVIEGISIPVPSSCNIGLDAGGAADASACSPNNRCAEQLSVCLLAVVTDRLAVCECYAANSACYVLLGCIELLPRSTARYCEESLLCTAAQCTGAAARSSWGVNALALVALLVGGGVATGLYL